MEHLRKQNICWQKMWISSTYRVCRFNHIYLQEQFGKYSYIAFLPAAGELSLAQRLETEGNS